MAKDDLYAFHGVILKCDKGATVLPFLTTPKKHAVNKLQIATVTDNVPVINIPSFGVCSITGSACMPVAPQWLKAYDGAQKVLGQAPLLFSSYCKCQAGGTIEIFPSVEAAMAALEQDKESRVDGIPWLDGALGSALTSPIGPILDAFTDGGEDVTQGVGRGFRAGLKGTWNGLVQMVSHPVETAKGLTKMVGIAVVGYGTQSPTGQFSTPEQRLKDFDSVFGTDLAPTHEAIGDAIADGWDKKVVNGTTEERSEVAGQVIEGVLEAVVGTKGAGAAVKGITTAGKFVIGADRLAEITAAIAKLQKAMKLDALASKVTGIFKVGSATRSVFLPLKGEIIELKNIVKKPFVYLKRTAEETATLRSAFNSTEGKKFLQELAKDEKYLKSKGLTTEEINFIKKDKVPEGYQVHHKYPLDDSGTNDLDNLVLIKNDPYHKAITVYQNSSTKGLEAGTSKTIDWYTMDGNIYP